MLASRLQKNGQSDDDYLLQNTSTTVLWNDQYYWIEFGKVRT